MELIGLLPKKIICAEVSQSVSEPSAINVYESASYNKISFFESLPPSGINYVNANIFFCIHLH